MKDRSPIDLPILGANGKGSSAAEAFHIAVQRMREQMQQEKRVSLLTHRESCDFPGEPSPNPVWADELDEARRQDSWVGTVLIIFLATTAIMGLAAFILG